jgi:hypothetical protein
MFHSDAKFKLAGTHIVLLSAILLSTMLANCTVPGSSLAQPEREIPSEDPSLPQGADARPSPSPPRPTSTPIVSPTPFICPSYERYLAVIIEPYLYEELVPNLTQFEIDLCQDEYMLILTTKTFPSPTKVRDYLASLYFNETDQKLTGALLVGDQPYAYQHVTITFTDPDIPPRTEHGISFQYYSDLDGIFRTSDGYQAPEGKLPTFDIHEGDTDWEIWVSVLPPFHRDPEQSIQALKHYFEKNHAYRVGQSELPRELLQIQEYTAETVEDTQEMFDAILSGPISWAPLSGPEGPIAYLNSESAGLTIEAGYEALAMGDADFTVINAHGHEGAVGGLTVPWLSENPLRTFFLWSNACSAGNLDNDHVILNSILYDPKSEVLIATANTTEALGMGSTEKGSYTVTIANGFASGLSFGDAVLSHVNTPLAPPDDRNPGICRALRIFFGDLSLKLRQE